MTNFEFDLINKTKKMVLLSQKYLNNIFNSKKVKNFKITVLDSTSKSTVYYGVCTNIQTFAHNYILDIGYIKICVPYKYINDVEYYGQPFIIDYIRYIVDDNIILIMMNTKYPYYKKWIENDCQPITNDEVPYCLDKPSESITADEFLKLVKFK